jgi:hypothetical protein
LKGARKSGTPSPKGTIDAPGTSNGHKIGDTVKYKGKDHKITGIDKDGKLELEPVK